MKLSDQLHNILLRWPGCKEEQQEVYQHCIVIAWYLFRFTLTELVYQGFEVVTPERWQSLIKHVQEKVEDHRMDFMRNFWNNSSFTSANSEDGDGGNGGINDSSTTSNSVSKSSAKPSSSDGFDICNSSVTTCVLFPRSLNMVAQIWWLGCWIKALEQLLKLLSS